MDLAILLLGQMSVVTNFVSLFLHWQRDNLLQRIVAIETDTEPGKISQKPEVTSPEQITEVNEPWEEKHWKSLPWGVEIFILYHQGLVQKLDRSDL